MGSTGVHRCGYTPRVSEIRAAPLRALFRPGGPTVERSALGRPMLRPSNIGREVAALWQLA
jgi:hypothetical protein